MSRLGSSFARLREMALAMVDARSRGEADDAASAQHNLEVLETELELQQEELLESQRRSDAMASHYRQLFADSPLALALLDSQLAIRELNHRACRLLGVTSARVIGLDFGQFVAAQDQEWRKKFERRDDRATEEFVLRQVGGTRRRCTVSIAWRDDGVLLMIDDVTPLRSAEEQRRIADERLARVLDDSHDGILFFETTTFLVTEVNEALTRWLGRPAHELVGRSVLALFPEVDAGRYELALKQQAVLGQAMHSLELRFAGRRELLHAEATVGTLREGPTVFTTLLIRDITDRLRLEQEHTSLLRERHQHQKLEAVRQLSAGLAHNLNNVLAAVLSCATVEEDAPREELLASLAEIRRATLRGREVTSHLGTLSRREPLRARRFDLLATLAEVAALAQRSFLATTELVLEVPAGHCFIEGDPSEWHQVFLNLAINARDAMKSTGRLTLAAEVDGQGLVVRVEDTGPGMPAEVLERAFEPFFTTKPPGEGTGLGLSYVDAVARTHGAALTCRSTPGRGTCFTFSFRGATLEASSAATEPAARPAKLATRILFVDDDEMVRRSTQRVLRRLGAEVTMASSGEEALVKLDEGPCDVVLSDLSMPGMSGLDLARVLHTKRPELPIVIVTGDVSEEQRRSLNALGVRTFVNKPFEDAELRAAIERALGKG